MIAFTKVYIDRALPSIQSQRMGNYLTANNLHLSPFNIPVNTKIPESLVNKINSLPPTREKVHSTEEFIKETKTINTPTKSYN